MTFESLKRQKEYLLLDCISGSQAYNLALPESDTDKKGVFILPKNQFFGFEQPQQLNNDSNDEVYFELKRLIELLLKNNPNILELLNTRNEFVLYKHPLLNLVKPEDFLSKLCFQTFAGYAASQIKKARGLNKKINRVFDAERKGVLDFCFIIYGNGSVALKEWLTENRFQQEDCGLSKVPHFRDVYVLYHTHQFQHGEKPAGIVSGDTADDVQVSKVPKGVDSLAVMNFNKDAYSVHCREFRDYWDWVNQRNEQRYQSTLSHGKSYDAKNMMHTFRLLTMAAEIAQYKEVAVYRHDREFLLKVRSGAFDYDELMEMVDVKLEKIKKVYEDSDLPEKPDEKHAENLLLHIREEFYKGA
ncbi:MAG: nucleotidyltransferase [Chitinophagaceae bacterium]|nr:MAG: nucleotidyltransferase [Chitinophagaceae bacterium]